MEIYQEGLEEDLKIQEVRGPNNTSANPNRPPADMRTRLQSFSN